MFQPSVHISQFHGFNLGQFAYSYESFYYLNFHFAKFLSLHSTASYNLQFTSIQMTALETLKSWEDMDAESWKYLTLNTLKIFFSLF